VLRADAQHSPAIFQIIEKKQSLPVSKTEKPAPPTASSVTESDRERIAQALENTVSPETTQEPPAQLAAKPPKKKSSRSRKKTN
jgi:hypothetical protein